MTSIALVTSSDAPALSPDDQLLVEPLQACGLTPLAVAWDDPTAHWEQFESIVLRSTWNYHLCLEPFFSWFDHLEALQVPIWNPVPALRWNVQKTNLRDLAQLGIPTIPTFWI